MLFLGCLFPCNILLYNNSMSLKSLQVIGYETDIYFKQYVHNPYLVSSRSGSHAHVYLTPEPTLLTTLLFQVLHFFTGSRSQPHSVFLEAGRCTIAFNITKPRLSQQNSKQTTHHMTCQQLVPFILILEQWHNFNKDKYFKKNQELSKPEGMGWDLRSVTKGR